MIQWRGLLLLLPLSLRLDWRSHEMEAIAAGEYSTVHLRQHAVQRLNFLFPSMGAVHQSVEEHSRERACHHIHGEESPVFDHGDYY